jgi:putative ABC transport system permease protein
LSSLHLSDAKYSLPNQRTRFVETFEQRLRRLPMVRGASVASAMPFYNAPLRALALIGRPQVGGSLPPAVSYVTISDGYFDTLGVHLLLGRPFSSADGTTGHLSAIVNQRFVQMFFDGRSPLGAAIRVTDPNAVRSDGPALSIVGVAPTIRQHYAQDLDPVVYVPYRQDPTALPVVFVRTASSNPNLAAASIRETLRELDSNLVLFNTMPLEQLLAGTGFANRVFLTFFSAFAAFALLLSAIGLYAVTRHTVTMRQHEIGVRMALGAQPRQVVWLFTRRILVVLAIGGAIGLAASLAGGRLIRGFLVETAPSDPATLVSISLVLVAVSIVATVMPARRALSVDAAVVLRCE